MACCEGFIPGRGPGLSHDAEKKCTAGSFHSGALGEAALGSTAAVTATTKMPCTFIRRRVGAARRRS